MEEELIVAPAYASQSHRPDLWRLLGTGNLFSG